MFWRKKKEPPPPPMRDTVVEKIENSWENAPHCERCGCRMFLAFKGEKLCPGCWRFVEQERRLEEKRLADIAYQKKTEELLKSTNPFFVVP